MKFPGGAVKAYMRVEEHLLMFLTSALDKLSTLLYPERLTTEES